MFEWGQDVDRVLIGTNDSAKQRTRCGNVLRLSSPLCAGLDFIEIGIGDPQIGRISQQER